MKKIKSTENPAKAMESKPEKKVEEAPEEKAPPLVRLEESGLCLEVTLNKPKKLNAINQPMVDIFL